MRRPDRVRLGKGVRVVVVAGAQDGALAVVGMTKESDERFARARMQEHAVAGRHVGEHPAEPVMRQRGEQVRPDTELGGGKAAVTALPPKEMA